MTIEDRLTSGLRRAADQIPTVHLDVESILNDGRRSLKVRRATFFAAAALVAVGGFALTERVLSNDGANGSAPADRHSAERMTDRYAEIREQAVRFSVMVDRGDARGAWDMLSRRAQLASGGFESWKRDLSDTRASYGWMSEPGTTFYLSPLISPEGRSVVIVTAAAPVDDDGSGLLQTLPVHVAGDEVTIDVDTDQRSTLEPIDPVFVAGCAGDGCGNPDDFRPTISDGMTFSVAVGPSNEVRQVMFAVHGDAALILGRMTPPAEYATINVSAEFDGADAPRETVFTVVIEMTDGEVESFGYRVLYEDGV